MANRIENFANLKTPADKKVLLELRHVDVKFNVRGRILNAIRDVSLKIYDGENIAIVGESGSGKSVLTKTFAGMLDSNGFISHGKIIFNDEELSHTSVIMNKDMQKLYNKILTGLNNLSYLGFFSNDFIKIEENQKAMRNLDSLTDEEVAEFEKDYNAIDFELVEKTNEIVTLNPKDKNDKDRYNSLKSRIRELNAAKSALLKRKKELIQVKKQSAKMNEKYIQLGQEITVLKDKIKQGIEEKKANPLPKDIIDRNELLTKDAVLSFGRYPAFTRFKFTRKYLSGMKNAIKLARDLSDSRQIDKIYAPITFRVIYSHTSEDGKVIHGKTVVDCAKVKYTKDWQKIRGCKIATVFQDPMTSLNPIIPIGRQIMTVILKHQRCSEFEAKRRAIDMMKKVGIPDPEKRFNDYPFQYSGGMRQRIVIAIALSCQPKILICDEPTTALDVTIQAQIIRLIKQLQKDLGFTTVYITHDLGVVANVADRVAVLYAGQVIELGNVEDIFYEPAHPYTWALLSSLPQLSPKGSELFSITGTPPSLYNKIVGDAFALRSNYAMAIDFVKEPPMFEINDHHFAKTWLLDERAPKIEKPEIIQNLHEKMTKVYKPNIQGGKSND